MYFHFSIYLPIWSIPILIFHMLGAFWLLYVAIITVKNKWDTLSIIPRIFAVPWAIYAWLYDVFSNWTWAYLILWDKPKWKEWTLSSHVGRLKYEGTPYQRAVARFTCKELLDPFEAGGHCK